MQAKELTADIEELRSLEAKATRQAVKNLLKQELTRLEASLKLIENSKPAQEKPAENSEQAKPTQGSTSGSSSGIYEMLNSYSWEQTDDFVKVYIMLEGIKASGADVKGDFGKQSFDVKIHKYKFKDFRLSIAKLCEEIDASASKCIVNSNNVTIKLAKSKKGKKWGQLIYKDEKFKESDVAGKEKDPSAGLMDMMKKMYEEGDDNMKRSIAEAWTKSKDQKPGDNGGMGDMGGLGGLGAMGGKGAMPGLGGLGGLGGMPGM